MRKEFLDLSRDRRTIVVALVLPLVAFPLFFGLGSYLSNPTVNPSPILVVNKDQGQIGSTVVKALAASAGITLSERRITDLSGVIANSTYDVAVLLPANLSDSVTAGRQVNVSLYYDGANGRAITAVSIIRGVLSSISQQIASQRLQAKGLSLSAINPIGLSLESIRKISNPSLVYVSVLFPTFLIYFTFLGSFYFIVDDISGEKERRSLEALFTLPPARSTFFLGKFTAAFLLSMLTAALGLIGTQFSVNSIATTGGTSAGFALPSWAYAPVFAMTGLASLSLTAIGFCVSTFAKNIREAQQYLGPIFFVVFVPIYFAFGLSSQQISQYSALPVIGYILLIRDVLLGTATPQEVGLSLGVNLVFLAFLVWLAIRMINSEKVVLRAA